jgi:hypothetical protein
MKNFEQLPLLKNMIDMVKKLFPYLSIDMVMVWLIIMSKPGDGFQKWHKDFALGTKTTKTIDVNLFMMKRSDLLGRPNCVFNSSENAEGKEANKPSLEDDKDNTLIADSAHSCTHSCREEVIAKKNCKQQSSAMKAIEQCEKEQFLVDEIHLGSCSPLPFTKPQPYTLFSLSTVESHMEYLC